MDNELATFLYVAKTEFSIMLTKIGRIKADIKSKIQSKIPIIKKSVKKGIGIALTVRKKDARHEMPNDKGEEYPSIELIIKLLI